jgi:hypothetical protein
MYALIKDNAIAQYPYTIGNLRRDNPSTSFPKHPTDETLADWDMHPVTKTDRPTYEHTKNISEGAPVLVGGVWTQVWNVADATSDEIATRIEQASSLIRAERDYQLSLSDWRVIKAQETGVALSETWVTYRQALRDISSHAKFPYLVDADWPDTP